MRLFLLTTLEGNVFSLPWVLFMEYISFNSTNVFMSYWKVDTIVTYIGFDIIFIFQLGQIIILCVDMFASLC